MKNIPKLLSMILGILICPIALQATDYYIIKLVGDKIYNGRITVK